MLLLQQMFIYDIIPEVIHLFQCHRLHKEHEITVSQYLPLIVVVTRHLALEADDMLFRPVRTVKLLQILMDASEQVRVVALEGTGRVQHILDDLLQPFAVRLVRKCLFNMLNDGRNLSGQPFLLGGRNSDSAFVTEGIGIPILVMDYKRRNDLYIHVLLTYPEADVRGRGGTLFQIDGNFHQQCVFDSHGKGI